MKIARAVAPLVTLLALGIVPGAAAIEPKEEGPPTTVTGGASVVGGSDELTGYITPHELATEYWFEYGSTNSYGDKSEVRKLETDLSESSKVSETVKGMQSNWRYRLVAKNKDGEKAGRERVFETKSAKSLGKKTGKAGKSAVKLSQPEAVLVGEALVLDGTVAGPEKADREVVLQASPYPYRTGFADLGAPTLTNAAGGFTFRVPHLSTDTHLRVATVKPPLLLSPTVTGLAAVRVSLKVRRDSRTKGIVRLYGTVSPAEVGAHVYFQLERPPKQKLPSPKAEKPGKSESAGEKEPVASFVSKFSTLVKRGTRTVSRFSTVVTIGQSGLYRAFVALPPGPVASGYSGTIGLLASPSARKKNRKK